MPDLKHIRACLAFLFLFLVWGCTTEPVETHLLLPVDFSNVPEDMVLTQFHTDKIEIRIKGNPRHIEQLNKKTILYPADLYTDLEFDPAGDSDSIEQGTYLLPVDRTRIPMNPSIHILDISPSYLSVRLEKKVTRTFKVSVPYTGDPAKGHMALAPACEPSTVDLTGAQSLINKIVQLRTKPVDLGNANEAFKKEVPLDLENPLLFSSSQPMFIVTVPIQALTGTKKIENLPIQIRNSPGKASIEPAFITVEIKGPQETLGNKAVTDQIFAFMDLKGLKKGVSARHAYINIPVDLAMTHASPQVFTVKIE
ncbi:MAG: YbbR-like domain-containing protein [Desulfobacter sp.]|nr:YbbR-like domain-containing protein [Desulfobacter sp.]WDP83937.1 MAG: YbbR-like domain-containing protein [Desulfobacter sp.]